MSVHKNKSNNTWYVKYKNTTKRGFEAKHDAMLYEAKLKLTSGENFQNVYLHQIADDYLKYYESQVSYGSYNRNKHIIENLIVPNTKNKRMDKITELDCRNFSEFVKTLDYSTKYKNHILNVYKCLFSHAVTFFRLRDNPSNVIKPFKKTYQEKKKKIDKEMCIWTDTEFHAFIKCVDKEMYKQLFVILYFTGLRLGEALALTWNDYRNQSLSITKSLTRKTNKGTYEIKEPKNVSSIRNVKLGKSIDSYLSNYKSKEMENIGFSENWFIFGRTTPLPQTSIDRIKDNAIKKANIKRIRIHDFRHSHASNLIANGTNIVAVSKRLGHSDVNMTLEVYTHLIKKSEDELIDNLEKSSQILLKEI